MFSAVRRRSVVALLLIISSLAAAPSLADPFDPLPTYDQSPLVQIFGLPAPGSARVLARGRTQVQIAFEATNNFLAQKNSTESLTLDGETHRTTLTVAYGTGDAEWGIEIPYLSHSGGFLDNFIENWHDFFGLPQGGRTDTPPDQLHYVYRRDGVERLNISAANRGIGDIRLLAARQLALADTADATLRASLKLPTGEAEQLHGSGAADVALWLTATCSMEQCPGTLGWNAEIGALALGRGDVLPELQRRLVGFGGAGLAWRAWTPIVLKAELRAHTSFYSSTDLAALGFTAAQLVLGGSWIINRGTTLDIGVSEDIRVATAPDVSILVGLQTKF